jgi:transposase
LETDRAISAAELERMMKVQDVILKAIATKIIWLEAAEIIGVCDRRLRRMRKQYEKFGYNRLFDQRRRKRSYLRVAMETAERVLALYRDTCFDLSVRHFHEKLREEHAIEISYSWVKQALQGAGLVARRKKHGSHRRRRPRKPYPGCCCTLMAASTFRFHTRVGRG